MEGIDNPQEDVALATHLTLLLSLLRLDAALALALDNPFKDKLAKHLICPCLFNITPNALSLNGVKCHSAQSRLQATHLIIGILKGDVKSTILFTTNHLAPLAAHLARLPFLGSSVFTNSQLDSSKGYKGVNNLSNICYMVSVLQQFY